jgi:subtilase family serine protease
MHLPAAPDNGQPGADQSKLAGNRQQYTPRIRRLAQLALAVTALAVPGCAQTRVLTPVPIPAYVQPGERACGTWYDALRPQTLQRVYQAGPLLAAGIDGRGVTVAIILPYTNPWLISDLATFSRRFGLPAAQAQMIDFDHAPRPAGSAADGWVSEGSYDLEMVHVMAPAARLIYLAVPPADTYINQKGLSWLITHTDADVVSYSEGAAEPALPVQSLRSAVVAAARAGVTIVASAGDYGATEFEPGGTTLYPAPTVAWPASDPLVTAVGGTQLRISASRTRAAPDTADDGETDDRAGGGGLSAIFTRPAYQDQVKGVVGDHRGIPDISMDASPCSAPATYSQAGLTATRAADGWHATSGTSMAAPLFAGLVADAVQLAGHRLGAINPVLYGMHGPGDGLMDITQGNTTTPAIRGYPATPGYDLATGLGTVGNATLFVRALAGARP